jgi:AraC-like DNA-binding protein
MFAGVAEDAFVPLAMTTDEVESFRGRALVGGLGAMHVTEFAVNSAIVIKRTPRLIGLKAPQYLKVNMVVRGRCMIAQDGREAVLGCGDLVIYDTTRPFRFSTDDDFHMYGVIVPAELLRLPDSRIAQMTARRVDGREGMGAFASRFLRQVGCQLAIDRHQDNIHLADATLDLLTASFSEQLSGASNIGADHGRAGLLTRIRLFIESRLGDPRLSVSAIAAAHYISVRHLQKLFEDEGQTVTGWIRSRRIEHCRKDLVNTELAGVAVGDICRRWGFANLSSFSKAFKAAYGHSPRDYRAHSLRPRPEPAGAATAGTSGC